MDFAIPADHPCLSGHFPERPLVPGVVLLERVLVAVEAAGAPVDACWHWPQVKFLQALRPDEPASIVLEGGDGRWRFRVLSGDRLLARGELRRADA